MGSPENSAYMRKSFEGGWENFLQAMTSPDRPVSFSAYIAAVFHATLGEVDKAFAELETAFEAMWQFRFMFYDLPGLMARNPQLQADYHQFVNGELQTILESHFREFIRLGLLKMDLDDIEPVSVNIWLVVKFWFAFEQTARPKAPINEASSHRGVRQVLALLKPYVQADFLPAFQQLVARHHTEN